MYGKHFQSTYTGSMYGKGALVFAVWGYVIAHTKDSYVEINPIQLAQILGDVSKDEVVAAIEYLCSPDESSRNKDHDGRRLIREGEYLYFVPTFTHYHSMQNSDDRREYMREYMKNRRKTMSNEYVNSCKHRVNNVNSGKHNQNQRSDSYSESKDQKRGNFVPPSLQEVIDYCKERSNNISANNFLNFYEAKGWMVGKNKMKDWKACIRTWEQRQQEYGNGQRDTRSRAKRHIDRLDELAREDIAKNGFTNTLDD